MEISEKNLAAVKKVVYDIFDNGKVKDVTMRLGRDSYGDDCIRVRLYLVPDTGVKDFDGRMFPLPHAISKVLDDDLNELLPFVEVRTI